MSNGTLTNYYFIPSLRRGLAAGITESAEGQIETHRSILSVDMNITAVQPLTNAPKFAKSIELLGPGDVLGFDPRIVVRTDPLNNVGDFEPNYFPAIEFAEPDFLWRFTANKADPTTGYLLPWISLIVLLAEDSPDQSKTKEFSESVSEVTNVPLITVNTNNLPNLDQEWRWAHVQVTAQGGIADEDVENELKHIIRNEPERAVSRLVCPRRLRPGMKYYAYVVPTFKLGVERALGNELLESDHALTLAWTIPENPSNHTDITFPYYYKWEFRTGLRGDFEHLIRQLEARPLPNLGLKEVDCGNPGFETAVNDGLKSDDDNHNILKFESALKSTNTYVTPWGKDSSEPRSGEEFRQELADLLNQSVDLYKDLVDPTKTPLVVAPVYGRWHRGRKGPLSPAKDDWLDELNLDPRHRSAAGVGTEIVKKQQEQLMASAWDQLGPIQDANEILMRAQFGREVGKKIEKRLKLLTDGNYLRATSSLHARIKMAGDAKTIRKNIHDSPIRKAPLDPALRRIARKRGSFRKRQNPDIDKRNDMLVRLNDKEIKVTDTLIPARGMANIETITKKLAAAVSPAIVDLPPTGKHYGKFDYSFGISQVLPDVQTQIEGVKLPDWLHLVDNGDGTATLKGTPPKQTIPQNKFISLPKQYQITLRVKQKGIINREFRQRFTIVVRTRRELARMLGRIRSYTDRYLRTPVRGLRAKTIWQVVDIKEGQATLPDAKPLKWFYERNITKNLVLDTVKDLADDHPDKDAGNAIAQALDGWLATDAPTIEERPQIGDINALCNRIKAELSPEKTIVQKSNMRLKLFFDKPRPPEQALDKIMAAPEFPQPLFESVEEISQELILRGIDTVRQNTIALIETNPRFIEALFCGANHEMARELLWREYPIDQRGSYFRQFFDVNDYVPKDGDVDEYLRCYLNENNLDPNFDNWNEEDKSRLIELYQEQLGDVSGLSPEEIVEEILKNKAVDEKLYDVPPLHKWRSDIFGRPAPRLGKNPNKFCSGDSVEEKLVLLIRGDVLKKYPNTVIYAVEGIADGNGGFIPNLPEFTEENEPGIIQYPIFGAKAKPDITFLGFNLTEEQARTANWYFVLQERVSESRFGMDVPSDKILHCWEDLGWHHFDISDDQYLNNLSPTEFLPDPEDVTEPPECEEVADLTKWDQDSTSLDSAWLASKTLQKPVRIIVSAKQMLPT